MGRVGVSRVLSSLALAGCSASHKAEPVPLVSVEVAPVDTAAGDQVGSSYPVSIARDREATLSVRVGGILTALPARIGERFGQGAVVAQVEATPYRAARDRAAYELARLERDARRNQELLAAGAISAAQRDDTLSALGVARASLSSARYGESSTTARMPFAGIILSRVAERGETVAAGQPLLTVADLASPIIAKARVPQPVAATLRRGASGMVTIAERTLPGRVLRVAAASDARTSTVEVDLAIQGLAAIASGSIGSVQFAAAPRSGPAEQRVPAEALLDSRGGVGHVFVVDRARSIVRRVPVRVLGFEGDDLRLTGLPDGASVVTSGAGFVSEGQRVAVTAR